MKLRLAALAVLLAGLGAALVWLRGSDPEVVRRIEAERADRYCYVTMNRVAIAVRDWTAAGRGPLPPRFEDLPFEGEVWLRCPHDPRQGEPSYALSSGLPTPAPSLAIVARELRPNHEFTDDRGAPLPAQRVLLGRLSVEFFSPAQVERYLADQTAALEFARGADAEDLVEAFGERRSAFRSAFAARAAADRTFDEADRDRLRRGLAAALEKPGPSWVEIEMASALARLGDPRTAVRTALQILVEMDRLNYFERKRLVELVQSQVTAEQVAAYGQGLELGLEPLDTRPESIARVRKLLEWWNSRG